jgi:hypothetical protein
MRLSPAMKAVLKLARQRTTDATTLARIWRGTAGTRTKSKLKLRRLKGRIVVLFLETACSRSPIDSMSDVT